MTASTQTPKHHRVAVDEEHRVATVTLDRPAVYNALTMELLAALLASFIALENDDRVRAIILTGDGKGFCSGQALDDRDAISDGGSLDLYRAVVERYNPLIIKLATMEKPVIAAVNGVAAGAGLGLALACDLRLAADGATFVTAFSKIGLVPDCGVSYFLPRLIGYGRALELALLSERVDSRKALELGLVNGVIADDELANEAHVLATTLARGPKSLGLIKREFARNGLGGLAEALVFEAETQSIAGTTADFAEGIASFREKRPPHFRGA